jgi:hypothetical protein
MTYERLNCRKDINGKSEALKRKRTDNKPAREKERNHLTLPR